MDWHDVDWNVFATDLAEKFIAGHPEYRFDGGPNWQGGTNRASRILREGELAIIKVFCEDERRDREVFALNHWQETGWTPYLIDTEGLRLITMTF